jgi:actin-related protein 5
MYPAHFARLVFTSTPLQWILQNHCEIAPDYPSLVSQFKDPTFLKSHERIIQFPYSIPAWEEKTEEELAKIADRRREQGKKLQEMAAKARAEKVRASASPSSDRG